MSSVNTRQPTRTTSTTSTTSYYTGYSKKYLPYRQQLAAGQADKVVAAMIAEEQAISDKQQKEVNLAEELRLVDLMERASLTLQTGDAEKTIFYCGLGQQVIEDRESESILNGAMSSIGSLFVDSLGAGEFGRYDATGYEKVLLLDFASMAYLLKGDDRAFNVARLAVEWQALEKEKFEQELEQVREKSADQQQKKSIEKQQHAQRVTGILDSEFAKYDNVALTVPNAFVNPFGDYVTGMVNEFKSVKIKSLLSNAHIAYKQALKLNPKSKVLKKAVKDTKKKRSASRLIHVVALDGFVPEKKVLSIPIDSGFDIEIPTYEPIPSKVKTIKVMTGKGRVLATLSPVANIEALALRHQKDSLPGIQAMVVAATLRDAAVVGAGNAFLGVGGLMRQLLDDHQEPDTTSWMTLPSKVLAARIYAPNGLKKLKIRSYDSKGRKLAEKIVKLGKGSRHFVLVRSIDKTMYAHPSKKIWSPKS